MVGHNIFPNKISLWISDYTFRGSYIKYMCRSEVEKFNHKFRLHPIIRFERKDLFPLFQRDHLHSIPRPIHVNQLSFFYSLWSKKRLTR